MNQEMAYVRSFKTKLEELIYALQNIQAYHNEKDACMLLAKVFGNDFPLSL